MGWWLRNMETSWPNYIKVQRCVTVTGRITTHQFQLVYTALLVKLGLQRFHTCADVRQTLGNSFVVAWVRVYHLACLRVLHWLPQEVHKVNRLLDLKQFGNSPQFDHVNNVWLQRWLQGPTQKQQQPYSCIVAPMV